MESLNEQIQRMLDKAEIEDVMRRYARGVDRGDMGLIRDSYHPDAYDDHVEYKGDVDGLIAWLTERFSGVDNSTHFLGNCLIEFAGPDAALVETYYNSRRIREPTAQERESLNPGEQICRQSWGRYIDRFERRDGAWRVASRTVVLESRFTMVVRDSERDAASTWGQRDTSDPLCQARDQLFGSGAGGSAA